MRAMFLRGRTGTSTSAASVERVALALSQARRGDRTPHVSAAVSSSAEGPGLSRTSHRHNQEHTQSRAAEEKKTKEVPRSAPACTRFCRVGADIEAASHAEQLDHVVAEFRFARSRVPAWMSSLHTRWPSSTPGRGRERAARRAHRSRIDFEAQLGSPVRCDRVSAGRRVATSSGIARPCSPPIKLGCRKRRADAIWPAPRAGGYALGRTDFDVPAALGPTPPMFPMPCISTQISSPSLAYYGRQDRVARLRES